jgi:NTE family protein
MSDRRKVALVVGSGGLKCVSVLGLWRALEREKIEVDLAVGCSGGSIYASSLALDWSVDDAIAASYELWKDRFRKRNLRSLLQIAFPKLFGFDGSFGLIDDAAVNDALRTAFGEARIESASRKLYIVTTDLLNGERVILSTGRIWDAVRASIAIPFVLRPWEIEGRMLADGGASDPLPIDVAMREGAEIILAMGFENAYVKELDAPSKLVLQTSTVAMNHLLRATFAFYSLAHHAEVIPIMPTFDRRVGLSDSHLIPYLIEEGERAAEREMPYLRRLLDSQAAAS